MRTMIFFTLPEMSCEPDYVANLKKYFNDLHNTGTYYKKITSKERKWCVSIYSNMQEWFSFFLSVIFTNSHE